MQGDNRMNLSDRMKAFEDINRIYLPPRIPIILRIDGCHFHTYTKGFNKPWDQRIQDSLTYAAQNVINNSGAEFAYIQSDEISLVLNTYKQFDTQAWFGGNVQKISSVAASLATAGFNKTILTNEMATFDCRCFCISREDVCNYFVWRQQDCIRNSVSSLAQKYFSHKLLHQKTVKQMREMLLLEKGINWETDISLQNQRGWCVTRNNTDTEIPIFSDDRGYIEKYLVQEEV
jgi:tRNA(His) 5'-end guanylyltransferase